MDGNRYSVIIKVLISFLVAFFLASLFEVGFFNVKRFKTIEYSSLRNLEIVDAELSKENLIHSINDDPQIIIKNYCGYIKNLSIIIEESLNMDNIFEEHFNRDFVIQVFYDTGQGFNANEVSTVKGKIGENLININTKLEIENIRIDPTNLANHELLIEKIIINKQPAVYVKSLLLIFIFNFACLLFINLFYLRGQSIKNSVITVAFYTYVLYIADNFWLKNELPILDVLLFVVICLITIVIPLFWKAVKISAEE